MSGILNLNKPAGISSAGALTRIKHLFPREKRPKIGHAGTLDPFASGVLLVMIGREATRRCEELMGQEKRYRATIKLGATTPTLDPTSVEEQVGVLPSVTRSQVEAVLLQFVGTIQQIPPAFSALKRGGKPLYEYARRGAEVSLEARPVRVYGIELMSLELPYMQIDVRCGRGTYIRSLARDIAQGLGTAGYLSALTRTAVGEFGIESAVALDPITAESLPGLLVR